MSPGTQTVELEVVTGQALNRRRTVDRGAFLIGTSSECDLVLASDGLPEICAIVTGRPDGVFIWAIGETTRISVNGQKISQAKLADGDQLVIGPFAFTVHIRPASSVTPLVARTQPLSCVTRWVHAAEPVDLTAMSLAARLRADIRNAIAEEPRTLRRPA